MAGWTDAHAGQSCTSRHGQAGPSPEAQEGMHPQRLSMDESSHAWPMQLHARPYGQDEGEGGSFCAYNMLTSRCSVSAAGPKASIKSGVRLYGRPLYVYSICAGVGLPLSMPARALPSVCCTVKTFPDAEVASWLMWEPQQSTLRWKSCPYKRRGQAEPCADVIMHCIWTDSAMVKSAHSQALSAKRGGRG